MVRFFEHSQGEGFCHILIEPSINDDDALLLSNLLSQKQYTAFEVEFGNLYSIDASIIDILYKEKYINKKSITITTHKNKLNTYFHKLGFHTLFKSMLHEKVLKVDEVEVILIGGSADSSSKIIQIVKEVDFRNLTLIVVQHVEPEKEGVFDKILRNYTDTPIKYAQESEKIKKGHIYIAPNNKHLRVSDGCFTLGDDAKYNFTRPSVSLSYESFSNFYKEKLLVIHECGYAQDGVDKLELLKHNDSLLVIQDINECSATPMIQHALNKNVHDSVLSIADIVDLLNLIDTKRDKEESIGYLLSMIEKKYSYNFKLYDKEMLQRRVAVFMTKHSIKNIKNAIALILFEPSDFKSFFLEVSINVTEPFRNPKSYNQMALFLKQYKKFQNIKVWSAGCSSGEEAYSMAILLDTFNLLDKSIIYATDFNKVILQEAKNALYSRESFALAEKNAQSIENAPAIDLRKYFTLNQNYVKVNEEIQKKVLFFEHNLINDTSFNEFDIIICKNVLIYFEHQLQKRVFQLFYDSLKFGGYLVLGKSESMIAEFLPHFEEWSSSCNIYKKVN